MILLDYSQVFISNMYQSLGTHLNAELNEDMLRHMVLNSIRSYQKKFSEEYGEMIICCDDGSSWRKNVFPYYKAHRKKDRDESELDWNLVFTILKKIRSELEEYFPYRVVYVHSVEADDIISVLCEKHGKLLGSNEPILILSGDHDFIQLHTYMNVYQYDPTRKRWIIHNDPEQYKIEHIIKGDRGDGVPNILSQDDSFVSGIRQKTMTAKRLSEYTERIKNEDFDGDWVRYYNRNKSVIDLNEVPEDLKNSILNKYNQEEGKGRSKLFNYFIKYRLKQLTEVINDF